jgi:reverse gyrase
VEAATAEIRADLAKAHEAIGQAQVEIVRLSSPVEQFRDAPPSPEFTEDLREAAAAARLAAQGIDAGAELVKFTAEHYNRTDPARCHRRVLAEILARLGAADRGELAEGEVPHG